MQISHKARTSQKAMETKVSDNQSVQTAEIGRHAGHGLGDFAFIGHVHLVASSLHGFGRAQCAGLLEVVGIDVE
jgi:hypothetical protein